MSTDFIRWNKKGGILWKPWGGILLLAARQRNHQPKIQATHQDYERVCKGKLLFQQCRLFPSFTLESHSQTPA
jgi:hypothetical protein